MRAVVYRPLSDTGGARSNPMVFVTPSSTRRSISSRLRVCRDLLISCRAASSLRRARWSVSAPAAVWPGVCLRLVMASLAPARGTHATRPLYPKRRAKSTEEGPRGSPGSPGLIMRPAMQTHIAGARATSRQTLDESGNYIPMMNACAATRRARGLSLPRGALWRDMLSGPAIRSRSG